MIYELLYAACRSGSWKGSYQDLAELSCCGSKATALRGVAELEKKGLITKDENGYRINAVEVVQNETVAVQNETVSVQNETNLKERSKENNLNNYKYSSTTTRTDFDFFWYLYSPDPSQYRYKKQCEAYWNDPRKMNDDWRRLAIKHAANHAPGRAPLFWLKDGDFLKMEDAEKNKASQAALPARPKFIVDQQVAEDLRKEGKNVWVMKDPETNKFLPILREDGEAFDGKNGYYFKRQF